MARFVAHCESCAQDVNTVYWWLGFCIVVVLERLNTVLPHFVFFSLIIVKSLQLCRCRQIAEPHKYYLMRVIVFLWHVFSLFLSLTSWEFRVNSLRRMEWLGLYLKCCGLYECAIQMYVKTYIKRAINRFESYKQSQEISILIHHFFKYNILIFRFYSHGNNFWKV